jgi:uncharacterized membrane protein YeaQ/YmgE (transglycosylase-associated protein family)
MSIIISLIIGGLAGLFAGWIQKGQGFGFVGNIIVGLIGGFIGNLLFGLLGIQDSNFIGSIIISTIGAVVLLYLISLFRNN